MCADKSLLCTQNADKVLVCDDKSFSAVGFCDDKN